MSPTPKAGCARSADPPSVLRTKVPLVPHHHQPVRPRLRAPSFAGPAEHLAHRGAALVRREALEFFCRGIEAQNCVGNKIRDPDLVLLVDINRVAAALAL